MRYKYRALDAQNQEISGELAADGEREAMRQLQRRELTVVQLSMLDDAPRRFLFGAGKVSKRDVRIILHELATMLESGVSLIEAVESLAESSHHPSLTSAFRDMAVKLRQGQPFSGVMRDSPLDLPWYVPQLLEAGEMTGKQAESLRSGVDQMEYAAQISSEMRSAMVYPTILIVSGIAAVILVFTLVVPKFSGILKSRGDDLPFLAQAVMSTGMFFNENFYFIIITLTALGIGGMYVLSNPELRVRALDLLSRTPVIGNWLLETETARWASMMATLLGNRLPLLKTLELAQQGIQLPGLRARLGIVTRAVRGGQSLSNALEDNHALTPTGHNLIRAGERAGKLSAMMNSLAKLYEDSSRTRMKRVLLLIEPIAILLIGGVIATVIIGVMLAITSVNEIGV